MADTPLQVFNLGEGGVDVDSSPLNREPNDFAFAKNAQNDPIFGNAGALRKRAGFVRFNTTWLGGPVLGGIYLSVPQMGGAPALGAGPSPTGTPDPSGPDGPIVGAPGDPTGPNLPPGSGPFGPVLFGGARLIIVGRGDNQVPNQDGAGWWVSSQGLANTAINVTGGVSGTPGPPGECANFPSPTQGNLGRPSVVTSAGVLFYAVAHADLTDTRITIRKTDGQTDVLVATIPRNPYGGAYIPPSTDVPYANYYTHATDPSGKQFQALTCMHLSNQGDIFVSIRDKYKDSSLVSGEFSRVGRVFKMSQSSGQLAEVGLVPYGSVSAFTSVPYAVVFAGGRIWTGTFDGRIDQAAVLYVTDDTTLTSSSEFDAFSSGTGITCMAVYPTTGVQPARVFLGLYCNQTVPTFQYVYSFSGMLAVGSDINATVQGSGGTVQNFNFWSSMIEFGDSLYAAFYNPVVASKIYKFTADGTHLNSLGQWDGTCTVTTPYTDSANYVPYQLFVDNGILYAVGTTGISGLHRVLTSPDGTTWTDQTSTFFSSGNTPHGDFTIPVLFGLNQS